MTGKNESEEEDYTDEAAIVKHTWCGIADDTLPRLLSSPRRCFVATSMLRALIPKFVSLRGCVNI